jgi:CheY-like chemotaxis protein
MTKHGTVLLIGDDANEILLIKKAFVEAEVPTPLHTVNSCKDAIAYFIGEGVYANRTAYPIPFLVLLDLKMSGEEGFAVLRWLYDRPGLRKKFTVIVTSPAGPEQDIQLAYELGAQSYLVKPAGYPQWVSAVRRVKDYWIGINLLPEDVL